MQVSRSLHLTDGCNKEILDLADGRNSENSVSNSPNDRAALSTAKIETGKNKVNPNQRNPICSTTLSNLDCSAMSNVKLKSSGNPKKPCTGSSFFDRYENLANICFLVLSFLMPAILNLFQEFNVSFHVHSLDRYPFLL